jgi:hypothetical protein
MFESFTATEDDGQISEAMRIAIADRLALRATLVDQLAEALCAFREPKTVPSQTWIRLDIALSGLIAGVTGKPTADELLEEMEEALGVWLLDRLEDGQAPFIVRRLGAALDFKN